MKNLLVYISPTGSFDNPRPDLASNDAGPLVKVQIDNSLSLGWKKEDIILVTNFDFTYGGFKATVLKDVDFFERKPQASKINAILALFKKNLIEKDQLYWFHDIDAYQLQPILESDVNINEDEIALTDYGGIKFGGVDRWSTGTIFFKSNSQDIFNQVKNIMYLKNIDEEEALGLLTINDPDIRKRVIKINNSYNFIGYYFKTIYDSSIKPLKVAHFHPWVGRRRARIEDAYKFFSGENPLKTPLITDRLIKIFKYHRIR